MATGVRLSGGDDIGLDFHTRQLTAEVIEVPDDLP